MYHISAEDLEGILTNASAFYLGSCRKGGLDDYAHVMASHIKTIRAGEQAMNYHHSPISPRLSTTNLALSGSVPVFVFNLVLHIT